MDNEHIVTVGGRIASSNGGIPLLFSLAAARLHCKYTKTNWPLSHCRIFELVPVELEEPPKF